MMIHVVVVVVVFKETFNPFKKLYVI